MLLLRVQRADEMLLEWQPDLERRARPGFGSDLDGPPVRYRDFSRDVQPEPQPGRPEPALLVLWLLHQRVEQRREVTDRNRVAMVVNGDDRSAYGGRLPYGDRPVRVAVDDAVGDQIAQEL